MNMIHLYIETNFLVGFAKNQDPEAETVIERVRTNQDTSTLQLAIPSFCCMESLSVLENENIRRNRFTNELEREIRSLEDSTSSEYAAELRNALQTAKVRNQEWINDINARLFRILDIVATHATLIQLNAEMLQASLAETYISDPTDNLILHAILAHVRQHPEATKVFLSSNTKDFGTPEIKGILEQADIKYLPKTKDFLGWLSSQE
jgi:hypothetical protein